MWQFGLFSKVQSHLGFLGYQSNNVPDVCSDKWISEVKNVRKNSKILHAKNLFAAGSMLLSIAIFIK